MIGFNYDEQGRTGSLEAMPNVKCGRLLRYAIGTLQTALRGRFGRLLRGI